MSQMESDGVRFAASPLRGAWRFLRRIAGGTKHFYLVHLERMTSVQANYAQRDTRLENITMTGFISNNGSIGGTPAQQNPAYAAIDLTKSRNFAIDTRVLTLRNSGANLLLRIYISSTKPPSYYQNFEFDIFITPSANEQLILIEIYRSQADAENAQINGGDKLYGITNRYPDGSGDVSTLTGILTFKVLNNRIILKSIPPSYSN